MKGRAFFSFYLVLAQGTRDIIFKLFIVCINISVFIPVVTFFYTMTTTIITVINSDFYTIWIFNFENIIAHQADKLEEIYKEKFSLFNRKQYENETFKDVIENEQLLAETMVRVDKRVRNSYHFNNHTFVDDGISDEFILEFAEGQETKELIKPEIVIKILKDWAAKATLAGKEIEITDS